MREESEMIEAMKQALRYSKQGALVPVDVHTTKLLVEALRAAIAETSMQRLTDVQQEMEQEPVKIETIYETIIHWDENGGKRSRRELARRIVALYAYSPRREWVELTDEEVIETYNEACREHFDDLHRVRHHARAIEAKLKERNT